jgi:hypothetical protein
MEEKVMLGIELVGMLVGMILSILVFTYLLGDNPLYRISLYIFLGALIGYSFGIIVSEVWIKAIILPWLEDPTGNIILLIPVLVGVLLILKIIPKLAFAGNLSLTFLIGVGTAVALLGAFRGTLWPQFEATANATISNPSEGLFIAIGTCLALLAFDFTFSERRHGPWKVLGIIIYWAGKLGRMILTVTFGIAFAGAVTAALAMFIGRTQFLIDSFLLLLGRGG